MPFMFLHKQRKFQTNLYCNNQAKLDHNNEYINVQDGIKVQVEKCFKIKKVTELNNVSLYSFIHCSKTSEIF